MHLSEVVLTLVYSLFCLSNLLILLNKTRQSSILIVPIQHSAPVEIYPLNPVLRFVLEHLADKFCQILGHTLVEGCDFAGVRQVIVVVDAAFSSNFVLDSTVAFERKGKLAVSDGVEKLVG